MAAIANFNFFYFFTAFIVIYFYSYYFKRGFKFLRNKRFYLESLFVIGIVVLVLKALWFITNCSNDIGAYGGNDLVSGIFMGFVHTLIYDGALNETVLKASAYGLCMIVLMASVYGLRMRKQHRSLWYTFSAGLLILMLVLTLLTKFCFDVLYPTYRTALMFYPLIAMVLVGFTDNLIPSKKVKSIIFYVISSVIALHFFLNLSLRKSFDYWQQSDTKTCFTYLDSLGAENVGIAPELFGVYRNYYQLTDKYRFRFQGASINTAFPIGADSVQGLSKFDYLVLFPPYNLSFYKNNRVDLKGVTLYKGTGTLVVRVNTR
jgi:hypothetical protein